LLIICIIYQISEEKKPKSHSFFPMALLSSDLSLRNILIKPFPNIFKEALLQ